MTGFFRVDFHLCNLCNLWILKTGFKKQRIFFDRMTGFFRVGFHLCNLCNLWIQNNGFFLTGLQDFTG